MLVLPNEGKWLFVILLRLINSLIITEEEDDNDGEWCQLNRQSTSGCQGGEKEEGKSVMDE